MFCSIMSINYTKTKTPVEERSLLNTHVGLYASVTITEHIPKAKNTSFHD